MSLMTTRLTAPFPGALFFIVVILATMLSVGAVSAQDYVSDYATVGSGSGFSLTTDYKVEDRLGTSGPEETPQSSSDYSTVPLGGVRTAPLSEVENWHLY